MRQIAKNLQTIGGADPCKINVLSDKIIVYPEGKPPIIHNEIPPELSQLKTVLQSLFSAKFESLKIQINEGGKFAYILEYTDRKGGKHIKADKYEPNKSA